MAWVSISFDKIYFIPGLYLHFCSNPISKIGSAVSICIEYLLIVFICDAIISNRFLTNK